MSLLDRSMNRRNFLRLSAGAAAAAAVTANASSALATDEGTPREIQLLRRIRDAALFEDGEEQLQSPDFHYALLESNKKDFSSTV